MDTQQSETYSCLFVSIRGWKYPARLINHEWTLMDTNQSENLFASIRGWKYQARLINREWTLMDT
jgi:hypothetical protein